MSNSLTVAAGSSTGTVGAALQVSGAVVPAADIVSIQLGQSATVAPTGPWMSATTSNGNFAGTLVPPAGGTWYVWAWDQATGLQAVSSAVSVPVPTAALVPAVPISTQQAADLLGTDDAGETADELPAAAAASNSDTAIVAQGGKTLLAQPFSAILTWILANLTNWLFPVVTVATAGTVQLDNSAHNKRIIVVTAAGVTLAPLLSSMSAGFSCDVINASSAVLTLSGMTTSSGGTTIAAGGYARILAYGTTPTVYAGVIA